MEETGNALRSQHSRSVTQQLKEELMVLIIWTGMSATLVRESVELIEDIVSTNCLKD